ncbi:hypothetical protein [Pantoea sp. SORGH_AS_0659]|uniref:hypothetical protein n=1 Tax=Pantoea sp. SORGH_AS_0659 TaxID=3062597 RepID=UPI00285C19C5|nr:hypothetical protein [Pantoea sp. SORGH_AS_0659]MDR6352498.1 hypothetical protein [Pantoea sp. SORGH_AS_0659]
MIRKILIGIFCIAMLLASFQLTSPLILAVMPSCEFTFTLITAGKDVDVVTRSTMTLRNGFGRSVGIYHGSLKNYDKTNKKLISEKDMSFHFELSNEIRGNAVKVSLLSFTPTFGNEVSKEDIFRYAFPSVSPGKAQYYRLLQINKGMLVSGETKAFPRSVCTKIIR